MEWLAVQRRVEPSSSARPGHCLSAYIEQIAHKQPPQAQVRGASRSVQRVVFSLQLRRAGAVGAGAATRAGTPTAADRHLGPIDLPARAAARQGHRSAANVCRMFVDVPHSRRGVCGSRTEGQGTRRAIAELDRRPSGRHPQSLHTWLGRFGHPRLWPAGLPRVQDVDALSEFLRGIPPKTGTHSSQVVLFDRQAKLAFRTVELPSAEHVAELLAMLAAA